MIGDHHQLPPFVKNMAFQRYSNMEQSLFTRFVRLGVKTIDLDQQGRARASIASLYNWRYKNLGNLQHVQEKPEFVVANPGFVYDFQFIDVGDFNGQGETEPSAHYVQNLGEAEYVVATFMYMRLLGYPAEKITVLTTYNGQKSLIRDVIRARCANNPLFGTPAEITTVDKFQGSQNDFVLLSLVRTKIVGHLRDVRRLVVAMSRARLGLYVFGRRSLFENCAELQPAFNVLLSRPTRLALLPLESFPTTRLASQPVKESEALFMQDMPSMADYVYRRTLAAVDTINKEQKLVPMEEEEEEEEVDESKKLELLALEAQAESLQKHDKESEEEDSDGDNENDENENDESDEDDDDDDDEETKEKDLDITATPTPTPTTTTTTTTTTTSYEKFSSVLGGAKRPLESDNSSSSTTDSNAMETETEPVVEHSNKKARIAQASEDEEKEVEEKSEKKLEKKLEEKEKNQATDKTEETVKEKEFVSLQGKPMNTVKQIAKLTVAELKQELNHRNITPSGLKDDLVNQLHKSLNE